MKKSTSPLKRAVSCCLFALGLATIASTTSQALAQGPVPLSDLAGTYMGYVSPTDNDDIRNSVAPVPSLSAIPNEDLGARIDLTVTSRGAASGRVVFGPTVIALAGALTVTDGRSDGTLLLPIPRYNRTVRLFLSSRGTTNGNVAYGIGSTATGGQSLTMYRNTWSGSTPPAYMTAYQTFVVYGGKNIGFQAEGIRLGNSPQGFGFGSIRASGTSGNYNIVGTLADGNTFTSSGFSSNQGQVLIYQYLYATLGGGVFWCPATINTGNLQISDQDTATIYIIGRSVWIKRPSPQRTSTRSRTWKRFSAPSTGPADTLYPNGFYQNPSIEGSEYIAPAAGQILAIPSISGPPVSIVTSVQFVHESLFSINFSQTLTITSPSATSRVNQISLNSPVRNSLRFTHFDVSTGPFKGTFILTPPLRPATFEGMLVKNTQTNLYVGYGYFIIRDLMLIKASVPDTAPLSDQRVSGSVILGD